MDERPRFSRPQCAQDWEDRQDFIIELYESKTLKETMRIMEQEHFFKATEKQYKKQLQKWDIDHKRIKPTEYNAMIRKKRQREEDGHTDVRFKLRGLEIDDAKIVRFQKRHRISEPEQVSDCPTPPDLSCTTPAPLPLPASPGLRPFPWFDMYERYLDLSMAGASTIQSNDMRSILRWLIAPFDNYEAQCRSVKVWDLKLWGPIPQHNQKGAFRTIHGSISLIFHFLVLETQAYRQKRPSQELFCLIVSNYLERSKDRSLSPSSFKTGEQHFVLWAVRIASTIRRMSGLRDEAFRLLETIIQLVKPDVDLENAETMLYYNEVLIELAHCCAEDGHQDEARDLLKNKLKFPSTLRCSSRFDGTTVVLYSSILRRRRDNALESVGELENGRGGTRFKRKRHARLQEGSSQPEASEWGPFLTDCMEWDKT